MKLMEKKGTHGELVCEENSIGEKTEAVGYMDKKYEKYGGYRNAKKTLKATKLCNGFLRKAKSA